MSSNPYRSPGYAGTSSASRLPKDLGPVTLWVTVVFIMEAMALVSMSAAQALLSARTGGDEPSPDEPTEMMISLLGGITALGFLLLYLSGIVLFCVWVYRANQNTDVLVSSGSEFTPGWAVGWFFVPIANIFKPFQVVSEIYRASDPQADPDYWSIAPVPMYIKIWWGSYLGFNLASNVAPLGVVQCSLGVVSMALAITITRAVRRMQVEKARDRSRGPSSAAHPAGNPLLG